VAHVSDGEKPDQISVAFCEASASLDQPGHPLEDFLLGGRQVFGIPGSAGHYLNTRVDVLGLRALQFVDVKWLAFSGHLLARFRRDQNWLCRAGWSLLLLVNEQAEVDVTPDLLRLEHAGLIGP